MLTELMGNIATTYGLSQKDRKAFQRICIATFVRDQWQFDLGKKELSESEDPNAILALVAFNNHFLKRPAPEPIVITPEDEMRAQEETAALMRRLRVNS